MKSTGGTAVFPPSNSFFEDVFLSFASFFLSLPLVLQGVSGHLLDKKIGPEQELGDRPAAAIFGASGQPGDGG